MAALDSTHSDRCLSRRAHRLFGGYRRHCASGRGGWSGRPHRCSADVRDGQCRNGCFCRSGAVLELLVGDRWGTDQRPVKRHGRSGSSRPLRVVVRSARRRGALFAEPGTRGLGGQPAGAEMGLILRGPRPARSRRVHARHDATTFALPDPDDSCGRVARAAKRPGFCSGVRQRPGRVPARGERVPRRRPPAVTR